MGRLGYVGEEGAGLILRPFLAITFSDLNSQKLLIPDTMRLVLDVAICRFYKSWKDTDDKTIDSVSTESSNFKCV